ncbi:MAG: FumA C-terminus/TtdB family hydratase beta subunit [Spirochaetota bacterium]
MKQHISLPLDRTAALGLHAGDEVLLVGSMLVARDQAHARLLQAVDRGAPLPVDITGQTIFYMGPSPAPPGRIVGSCGPTTSARMDYYTPKLLEQGLRAMVGKGPRSDEVVAAIVEHQAVYFAAFGGCGALYAECVEEIELIAYEDLGPEAIYRITVRDFPVIVAIDSSGNSLL